MNYRAKIIGCYIATIAAMIIAALMTLMVIIALDLGLGMAVLIPPLAGIVIPAPLVLRMENKIQHYKKMLEKEKEGK